MTNAESQIPVALLLELILLDQETGRMLWKARNPTHFVESGRRGAQHICNNWNSSFANTPALACVDGSGHLVGRISRKLVFAHRVVFAMQKGHWPEHSIDHINGDPSDNRIENLRDVPHIENLRNQVTRKNNTTGVTGVSFNKRLGKWMAHICVKGKYTHLGFFLAKDAAVSARQAANIEFGFHQNHGRAAS